VRPPARACLLCGALAGAAIVAWPRPAAALDRFEIQVYDGSADPPGTPGIELHANTVASGLRAADPPELPPNHQTHLTLEPSLGLLPWWEIGGYLQSTIRPDGGFDFAGVKLRSKFVRPSADGVRLGVNLEVSAIPAAYERDRWGGEVRPIIAFSAATGRLAFAFNPILDFAFTSPAAGQGPSFEPALSAVYVAPGLLSVGVELYSDYGPLAHPVGWSAEQHYVFEVVNVLRWKRVELNAGVGEGLTAASNRLVVKVILGFE
jgi:hypothetical protein